MTTKTITLATRGSALALWQANFIADQIRARGGNVELSVLKTTGDIVQDRFLHEIGGKGLFIKELEEALKDGRADLAMHSLKDMPVKLPEGFQLTAILKRHAVTDAIIFKKELYPRLGLTPGQVLGSKDIKALGPMRIATSSLRRQALLTRLDSGIEIKPIRGNVDTRLRKLEEQDWSALILAEASLDRLNLKTNAVHRLDPQWFVPCAGQGAIAIETLKSSAFAQEIAALDCKTTRLHVTMERAVLEALGGDCTMPFGCLIQPDPREPNNLLGRVIVLDLDGGAVCAMHSMPALQVGDGHGFVKTLLDGLRKENVNGILAKLNISKRL